MHVTDQAFQVLNALLAEPEQETLNRARQLTDAGMPAFEALLEVAVSVAACQRFAAGCTDGNVIRYVARIRAGTGVRDEDIVLDPAAAEATLRRAVGKPIPAVTDPWARIRPNVALLTVLASDLDLDEPAVEALLAQARAIVDHASTKGEAHHLPARADARRAGIARPRPADRLGPSSPSSATWPMPVPARPG
jgi:hypothetical protein